jgi:general secretion pathway protein F
MPTYTYAAYDGAGKQVSGVLIANNADHAASQLRGRGLLPFETAEARITVATSQTWASILSRRHIPSGQYAEFCRQLATLLQADLPLDQCLRLMVLQGRSSASGQLANGILSAVISGAALSSAFEQSAAAAPMFIAPLIRAGEARGTLSPALADIARILERQADVSSRIRSALTYPAVLLLVVITTIVIIVGVLVPALLPLFRDNRVPPPSILRFAATIESTVRESWVATLIATLLIVLLGGWLARLPTTRQLCGRVLIKVPGIGQLVQRTNTALMARTLGTLLRNGVSLVAALKLSAAVVTSAGFKQDLGLVAQAVQEGRKLTTALQEAGFLADLPLRFISIGEEASKLDDMLLHLADQSDAENIRQIERLLTLLTPVLTLLLGGMVGGLILSVMQAVLSINDFAFK